MDLGRKGQEGGFYALTQVDRTGRPVLCMDSGRQGQQDGMHGLG
jgi:hypothetical protein